MVERGDTGSDEAESALKRFYGYDPEKPWEIPFRCLLYGVPILVIWVVGNLVLGFPAPPLVSDLQEANQPTKAVGGVLLAGGLGLVPLTVIRLLAKASGR